MTEQRKNSYEDSDLRQILGEIEDFEAEKVSIRATAAGECGGIAKQIGNAKGRAKELGIPAAILNGLLKTRNLERQIAAVADGVPEDHAEMWVDAVGQFSFLAPDTDEEQPKAETGATKAAKRRQKQAKANQEAEQAEGASVLDDLVH